MAKGRTPDKAPNKVMTPGPKSVLHSDGSRTFSISFNDENGVRHEGEITIAVENGALTVKESVVS